MSKITIEEKYVNEAMNTLLEQHDGNKDLAFKECCELMLRNQVRRNKLIKILNLILTEITDKDYAMSPVIYTGDKGLSEFRTVSFSEYMQESLAEIDIQFTMPNTKKRKRARIY